MFSKSNRAGLVGFKSFEKEFIKRLNVFTVSVADVIRVFHIAKFRTIFCQTCFCYDFKLLHLYMLTAYLDWKSKELYI